MNSKVIFKQFLFLSTSQYAGLCISITGGIFLTRFLEPTDFGVIAAFLFYLSSFNWISEFGWDQGFMVHKEVPLNEAAGTHCMIRTITGLMPLITFLCLKKIGFHFSFQNYFYVLLVLGLSYFFEKISVTPKIILERNYQLGSCAFLETTATIISYMTALFAAIKGWGAMSLALQRLIEKSILCSGYFYLSPWKYSIKGSFAIVKLYLFSFGLATYLGSLASLIIYDFMGWFVAWYVTPHDAGLYAKAFNLATFPLILTAVCSRLTIPLYTQFQNDVEQIKKVFVKIQLIKMVLLIPFQTGLVLTSWWWIPRLLGPQWNALVPIYNIMASYGLSRAFFDDVPNVLTYGFRNPWILTQSQAIQATLIICIGFFIIPSYAAQGSAITMALSMSVTTVYLWYHVFKQLACSPSTFYAATHDYWIFIKKIKDTYVKQK